MLLRATLSLHGVHRHGTVRPHLRVEVRNQAGVVWADWRVHLIEVALRGPVRRRLDLEISCSVCLVLKRDAADDVVSRVALIALNLQVLQRHFLLVLTLRLLLNRLI